LCLDGQTWRAQHTRHVISVRNEIAGAAGALMDRRVRTPRSLLVSDWLAQALRQLYGHRFSVGLDMGW
jgi:hypothetical protein